MLLFSSKSRAPTSSMKSSPSFWIAQTIGAILLCPPDLIERRLPMIAPLPTTIKEIKTRKEVEQVLNECWKNPDAGYEVQPTDEWIVNNQQEDTKPFDILEQEDEEFAISGRRKPSTYGEITSLGARQLFGAMGLMNREDLPIHFFDLGSGTGKLVGQAILELPSKSVKATGIELSPSRHESAIQSREALMELASPSFDNDYYYSNQEIHFSLPQNCNDRFELLQGDLFDTDLSTATHIYVASLCFPHELMVRLEDTLQQILLRQRREELREGTNVPELEWVATLQPFPNNLGGIHPIVRFMEMSWTKPFGCAVYLYRCKV